MDEQLKRRLVGASVLVALAVIFLPMLLTHEPVNQPEETMQAMPKEPPRAFDESLLQAPQVQPTQPVAAVVPEADDKPPAVPKTSKLERAPTPVTPVARAIEPKKRPPSPKSKPKTAQKPLTKPKPASGWVVQAASLSSLDSARRLVKKLRKAGFDTLEPKPVIVKGKRYYRVRVGPEISKWRAQRMVPKIKKITGVKGQVVRYP